MSGLWRFLLLSLSPTRGIPDAWDVKEMLVAVMALLGASGTVGWFTNLLTSIAPGIGGGFAFLGLGAAALFGWAGIRLQRQLDTVQARKHIPDNRDALISAIHNVRKFAHELLSSYWPRWKRSWSKSSGYSEEMTFGDEGKEDAYITARHQLELQEKIAGPEYATALRLYQNEITSEVDKGKYSELNEDGHKRSHEAVDRLTEEVLRRIDDGTLYAPQTATSS